MADDVKITREYVPLDEAVPKPSKNLVEVVRCKDCNYDALTQMEE